MLFHKLRSGTLSMVSSTSDALAISGTESYIGSATALPDKIDSAIPKLSIIITVVFKQVFNFTELNAGVVGLALAYTISLAGTLQFCVRQSAEIENLVG